MITSMDNGSITGKEYPKTLAEAYEVTRLWVVPAQKKAGSTAMALVVAKKRRRPGWRQRIDWRSWFRWTRERHDDEAQKSAGKEAPEKGEVRGQQELEQGRHDRMGRTSWM